VLNALQNLSANRLDEADHARCGSQSTRALLRVARVAGRSDKLSMFMSWRSGVGGVLLSLSLTMAGMMATALAPIVASQAAQAGPAHVAVLTAQASPDSLPSAGGAVNVVSKVKGDAVCSVAVLGDHGVAVWRPKPTRCSGLYRAELRFGRNALPAPVTVKLGLIAGGARGVFYVVVSGTPRPPEILEARSYPWRLPPSGGWVSVRARVLRAVRCRLVAIDWPHPDLAPQACSSGVFSERLWIGPNLSQAAVSEEFEFIASGDGTATGKFYVSVAHASQPQPATTPAPTVITTTVPVVTTTTDYVQPTPQLQIMPPAPVTSPGTTTSTTSVITTTTVPTTTTTASTTTTTVPTTTTTASTTTTTVPTTTTTTASVSTTQLYSNNWSGWASERGPYSDVQASFIVPQLTSSTTCGEDDATWIGIDGTNNSDLIQAGVEETPYNPSTGVCDAPNKFYTFAWWEILPAPETSISTWNTGSLASSPATVHAGDQVSVSISISNNVASINITDDTTGGEFTTQQTYSGPAESAEAIQEAITSQSECSGQCKLAPFCTLENGSCAAAVNFSGYSYVGATTQNDEIFLVESGSVVARPTSVQNGQFSVDYVGQQSSSLRYASELGRLDKDEPYTGRLRVRLYAVWPQTQPCPYGSQHGAHA